MDLDQYQNLYNYLETEQIPDNLNRAEQRQIMNQSQFFEIQHNLLYKWNRKDDNRPLWIIKWTEVEPVLYMMHKHLTGGYLGMNAMYDKINERYY